MTTTLHDPMMQPTTSNQQLASSNYPLFAPDTRQIAGAVAARFSARRYQQILDILEKQPSCIFEVASILGCFDHQISGRFGEMEREDMIEKSGQQKIKPETGCPCEVYRIRIKSEIQNEKSELPIDRLLDQAGYPLTINLDGQAYDRHPVDPKDPAPGVPYVRRADRGGAALAVRVHLEDCPGCGRPLRMVMENGKKTFRCGIRDCMRQWEGAITPSPGRGDLLALVLRTL